MVELYNAGAYTIGQNEKSCVRPCGVRIAFDIKQIAKKLMALYLQDNCSMVV